MTDDFILAAARGILSKYLRRIPHTVVIQTKNLNSIELENSPDHDRTLDRDLISKQIQYPIGNVDLGYSINLTVFNGFNANKTSYHSVYSSIVSRAQSRIISDDVNTCLLGFRDLHIFERVLKTDDKHFSFGLSCRQQQKNFRLQGEIILGVAECLGFHGQKIKGFQEIDVFEMLKEIYDESCLTPCVYAARGAKKNLKEKSKLAASFKLQNRKLKKALENPFERDLTPQTYRFTEICMSQIQSQESNWFRDEYWNQLVKARINWTNWFIERS